MNKNIEVKFSTLSGPQKVVWTLEEALQSNDLSNHVKALVADPMISGMTVQHQFYGRVEINWTEES